MELAAGNIKIAEKGFWGWIASHRLWVFLAFIALNIAIKLPYLAGTSIFLDESVAIHDTQGTFAETIEFSANDPTPPLYYLTIGLWCKIFGASEMSARFPSMLFSSVTAGLIFILGFRFFNVRAGIFSALLFSVSNVAIVFAHEARAYAMASMLMVISYYFFLLILENPKVGWRAILGLTCVNILLLYTHYLTAMGLATQAILSLGLLVRNWRIFLRYAASQLLVLIAWLPWVVYNRSLLKPSKVTSWLKPPNWDSVDSVLTNFSGSIFLKYYALVILVFGGFAVCITLVCTLPKSKVFFPLLVVGAWLFLSMFFQIAVAHVFMPVFDLRYVMYALPGGILLIGAILSYLPGPKIIQYVLAVLPIGISIGLLNLNPQKPENWRDAVALIQSWKNAKTAIVINAYYQYLPFSYYYNRSYFQDAPNTMSDIDSDNIHLGKDSLIVPKIDDSLVTNVILILSHDALVDPQGSLFEYMRRHYCISNRAVFPGIKVYQFKNPPCFGKVEGHYSYDFEALRKPEDSALTMQIIDSTGSNRVTFVKPNHEFSAAMEWKSSALFGGNFHSVDIGFRGKITESEKKLLLVFVMEHNGEAYNWTGVELHQKHPIGTWFKEKVAIQIPEVKSKDDKVKVYFWSPDGNEGYFDDLEVDFWQ